MLSTLTFLHATASRGGVLESSGSQKMRLGFGISPLALQSEGLMKGLTNFGGVGFNSSIAYQGSSLALGIKSIAAVGLQGKSAHGLLPYTLVRELRFVSFAPFVEYAFSVDCLQDRPVFIAMGPSLSLTSFSYAERLTAREEEKSSKIVSRGRGIDVSVGLVGVVENQAYRSYLALNFLSIRSSGQRIVDSGTFEDPVSFKDTDEGDLKGVQIFSLNFGLYLI